MGSPAKCIVLSQSSIVQACALGQECCGSGEWTDAEEGGSGICRMGGWAEQKIDVENNDRGKALAPT